MIDYKNLSLANQVYDAIEQNILNGVYASGEIISESKLSEELGVSRTPVREAMARLENERLIGITPSGTVVLGITDRDVRDMFEVKLHLEPIVSVMASQNISQEALAKLKDIIDQQEFYASKHNTERIRNLDTEFHDLIYSECGSPVFQSILSPIHHKLLKYRKASLEKSDRSYHSVEEHMAIYEALKAKDRMQVEMLMLEHIRHAYENIKKGVTE
ncbi:MAG: GntR family transcriptional regulator [Candidatus Fimisoma sp.]|jgi:DNA-binding GntR family transcriptional regulator|nr:GntR family transcriptional regulator [Bacillota bacterium]MDD7285971.1 GntR family transcriptional regulator [Bacillota bacterium]MDY4748288.1 GntR family transcriptional regulator [Candidatus Fimisoma sp.]